MPTPAEELLDALTNFVGGTHVNHLYGTAKTTQEERDGLLAKLTAFVDARVKSLSRTPSESKR